MRPNWQKSEKTVAVPNGRVCADGDTVGTAGPGFFEIFAILAQFAQKIAQNAHIITLNIQ
jgi:ABC-type Fe3+-hydroxamate transport system substrate-binding protein